MWKYISRRIRDTFERSANHFDKRSAAGVTNPTTSLQEETNKWSNTRCSFSKSRCCEQWPGWGPQLWRCWGTGQWNSKANHSKKWNFHYIDKSWLGAVTWSSALVMGWYASQLIHMKRRRTQRSNSVNKLSHTLQPFLKSDNTNKSDSLKFEKVVASFARSVYLISNDKEDIKTERQTPQFCTSSSSSESSSDELSDVLNSIENKLGLAALENGQFKDGINLLRSAATRNHAPALYNLGLCYELGFGVKLDEKMAMELYRAAAALKHPGALYNLGIYYGQGRGGLARDFDTATRLLRLAAVQGQQDAIDALKSLDIEPESENQMTWPSTPLIQSDVVLPPTHTSLFVGANLLVNNEGTVY